MLYQVNYHLLLFISWVIGHIVSLSPETFCVSAAHSPDNSFMGFVVEHHLTHLDLADAPRKNIALVYGKNEYMWDVSASSCDRKSVAVN